ncbi:methylated-DNA--[protein]-cysteine S-methyltransferase [Sphingomonas sp. ID1715]|uniref:methylated-DNA--[protein]-cysteine S-methyltransferase n=1 Tax=Sphingomonas sp. ID1715 TaxID=1656898 RepID=UPI001488EE37|nr:methylated-DNA--[protein]-cysteine S-methyltransferase [Sphingomonas sp. ID1715]NNM77292.1 methylated-DNA--[protein]-cysteine S-methyltransferase [Sphingomonas sp. ID1715]
MAYAPGQMMIATPIGTVRIDGDGRVLTGIRIGGTGPVASRDALLNEAAAQLSAYFAGELTHFDLPLAEPESDRGPALRAAICAIGYGETATYGALAERTGASARAIGQACASNSFPILVPCHRVLSAGGALGHYSAGDGPATKVWLLKHENAEGWLI